MLSNTSKQIVYNNCSVEMLPATDKRADDGLTLLITNMSTNQFMTIKLDAGALRKCAICDPYQEDMALAAMYYLLDVLDYENTGEFHMYYHKRINERGKGDENDPEGTGWTAISNAVIQNNFRLYKFLMSRGADPNIHNIRVNHTILGTTYPRFISPIIFGIIPLGYEEIFTDLTQRPGIMQEALQFQTIDGHNIVSRSALNDKPNRISIATYLLRDCKARITWDNNRYSFSNGLFLCILRKDLKLFKLMLSYATALDMKAKNSARHNLNNLPTHYLPYLLNKKAEATDVEEIKIYDQMYQLTVQRMQQHGLNIDQYLPKMISPVQSDILPSAPDYNISDFEDGMIHAAVITRDPRQVIAILNHPDIQQNKNRLINAYDKAGCTPLHRAIPPEGTKTTQEHIDIITILLKHGARIDKLSKIVKDEDIETSILADAISNFNVEMALHLISIDVDKKLINLKTSYGHRPIELAAILDQLEVIKILVEEYHVTIERDTNEHFDNPLHHAFYNGSIETIEFLLPYAKDFTVLGENGSTYEQTIEIGKRDLKKDDTIDKEKCNRLLAEQDIKVNLLENALTQYYRKPPSLTQQKASHLVSSKIEQEFSVKKENPNPRREKSKKCNII